MRKIIDGVKAAANFHKFGIPYTPPSFHNALGDMPNYKITSKTLSEIRAEQGIKNYLYVITEDRKLIIGPEGKLNPLDEIRIHHHDLAKNTPVKNAGHFIADNGFIKMIDHSSGHFLPEGSHLAKLTEKIFQRNGFNEAIGKYVGHNDYKIFSDGIIPIVTHPHPGLSPHVGTGAGVLGIIGEGLRANQAEQARNQQQKAHEKLLGKKNVTGQQICMLIV